MADSLPDLRLLASPTHDLVARMNALRAQADTPFAAAQALMPYLGAAHVNGYARIGFWAPDAVAASDGPFWLESLTPLDALDLRQPQQTVRFARRRVALQADGDFLWGVVDGLRPGDRETIGDFYQLVYQDRAGGWQRVVDYLAASVPFGVFAPAEYYDIDAMQRRRADREHFQRLDFDRGTAADGISRIGPPTSILQLHIAYASPDGTLEGLTAFYRELAAKVSADAPLTAAEQAFLDYDAVQLMPIEPVIEYEAGPRFWVPQDDAPDAETLTVTLRAPDMTNWGYDVVLAASPATNPALLGSKRPDELLDFIAVLHTFPGKPIKVIFDIVYGHADNQALDLLASQIVAGANMYGQNVAFSHPITRALLLEMMRRKHSYGVDGVRVDGAQDFKNWDPASGEMWHDDDFLRLMNDITLKVAGQTYRPWMIFEDGRPWPRDDWELASTYREVTRQMPNVWQWGPLTFAHNTPFLFTFWAMKWWRVCEVAGMGREWITGCANHDTLRRGAQVPTDARVNTYLGESLPAIIARAYDNPAARLFDYAMMPGVPMDFINANLHAPWAFIRNTDDRYGVKIAGEEARFIDWRVTDDHYAHDGAFSRLKDLGFSTRAALRRFMTALDDAVRFTEYDLERMAAVMNAVVVPELSLPLLDVAALKRVARAWMDDLHDFCNVWPHADAAPAASIAFDRALRRFRRERPWLMANLRSDERIEYRQPTEGAVLYFGRRCAAAGEERLLFVANMEGEPTTVTPVELPLPSLRREGWEPFLITPGLSVTSATEPLTLADSEGVVFRRVEGA